MLSNTIVANPQGKWGSAGASALAVIFVLVSAAPGPVTAQTAPPKSAAPPVPTQLAKPPAVNSPAVKPIAVCGPGQGESVEQGEVIKIASVNAHMDVAIAGGRILRLRGLRPPRGTKDWPELAAMAREALAGWISTETVRARIDKGPADRWGRLSADLFAAVPGKSRPADVTAGLIEAGWALADPETLSGPCLRPYLALEDKARRAGLGLWADARYKIVQAIDVAGLKARAGEHVLVEGKVLSVRNWRNLTFVNFARRRGEGLSLLATARRLRAFEQSGTSLQSLTGKTIRLRGLVEDRNGPRMVLPVRAAVELVE